MDQLRMDLENNVMPLYQRLEDLGIDPVEYKTYVYHLLPRRYRKAANAGTVYTEANKKSTNSRKNGSQRPAKKQHGSGKSYKTHPTT
jgi:hypothetical protein